MSFESCLEANSKKVLYQVVFDTVTANEFIGGTVPVPSAGLLYSNASAVVPITNGSEDQILAISSGVPAWKSLANVEGYNILSSGSSTYVSGDENTNCVFGYGSKSIQANSGLTTSSNPMSASSFMAVNDTVAPFSMFVVPPNTTYTNCVLRMWSILNNCTQSAGAFFHTCELHTLDSIISNVNQYIGFNTTGTFNATSCTNLPRSMEYSQSSPFTITNSTSNPVYYAVLWGLNSGVGSTGALMSVNFQLLTTTPLQ
jgi:hypothetical protein